MLWPGSTWQAGTWGQLLGPLVAGLLAEWSLLVALVVPTGFALVAACVSLFLDRLRPFAAKAEEAPRWLLRRPGVITGCWSGMTTGAWRGLVSSYVPVILVAHHTALVVGVLISVGNAAVMLGALWMTRHRSNGVRGLFIPATVLCGAATGALALVAANPLAAGAALAVSGAAVGTLQVVGPAMAVDAVSAEERADAIAATGTFRALAMLGTPVIIAGLLSIVALGPSMAAIGLLMAIPALSGRAR